MVATMLKAVHINVLNLKCMASSNFLPPDLRSKVLEKKRTTMKECTMEAAKYQRFLLDRPVGAPLKPRVLSVDEDVNDAQ